MRFVFEVFSSFIFGITLPVRAIILILSRKKLLFLSFFPIFLSVVVSVWGVSALTAWVKGIGMDLLTKHGYAEGTLTASAASIVFTIVMWILAAIAFSFIAGVLASPFNDALSENTEKETSLLPVPKSERPFFHQTKLIGIDILKTIVVTGFQFTLLFLSLLLFWVPVLNVVLGAASLWLMCFQFLSYPQTRREEGVLQSLRFLGAHPVSTLSFGAVTGAFFAIPLLSVFALPTAVVGGTLLYARAKRPETRLR